MVAVLDNVRSLYNVGSFFRTSDALGLSHLLLCGITGTPPHAELRKSALGAEVVPWQHYTSTRLSGSFELRAFRLGRWSRRGGA